MANAARARVKGYKSLMCFEKAPGGSQPIMRACYLCTRPNHGLLMRTYNWAVPVCPQCFTSQGFGKTVPFEDTVTKKVVEPDNDIDLIPLND